MIYRTQGRATDKLDLRGWHRNDGNRVNVVELELCGPVRPILQVQSFVHRG